MNFLILLCVFALVEGLNQHPEGRDEGFDLIAHFAKEGLPGKCVNGALCWTREKLNRLTIKLSNESVYFRNFDDLRPAPGTQGHLILADAKCENRIKKDKQKLLRSILFMDVTSCEDVPKWNFNFALVNIYLLDNMDLKDLSILRCSKRGENFAWKSQQIGVWDPANRFIRMRPTEKDQVANEEAKSIAVAYVASPETAKHIEEYRRHLNIEAASRFNYQIFNELFSFLNLTPLPTIAPDAYSLETLSTTSKELIAYPLRTVQRNFTSYDFLTSRTPQRRAFLLRAPSLSSVSNVFTLPLALNVWYASYLLLAIILAVIFLIVKVEWRFPDMVANKSRIMYPRMMDVLQMHVGAIAQQGSEAEPTSSGGRIATFLAFLFFLFIYTAYSANIVALLGSTTTRVHGVTDLKEFNIKLGIDKKDFTKEAFKNQSSKEHQALFRDKLAKDECYMSLDEGIDRIRREFFAFHGDSDKIYKMIDRLYADNEKCGFVEIPYLAEPELLIPIRKDSQYKEAIKIGLALFLERGLHNRIKNIIFAKQPSCYVGGSNFVSVALLDCYFAFALYAGGLGMSFIIFVMEMIMARTRACSSAGD